MSKYVLGARHCPNSIRCSSSVNLPEVFFFVNSSRAKHWVVVNYLQNCLAPISSSRAKLILREQQKNGYNNEVTENMFGHKECNWFLLDLSHVCFHSMCHGRTECSPHDTAPSSRPDRITSQSAPCATDRFAASFRPLSTCRTIALFLAFRSDQISNRLVYLSVVNGGVECFDCNRNY